MVQGRWASESVLEPSVLLHGFLELAVCLAELEALLVLIPSLFVSLLGSGFGFWGGFGCWSLGCVVESLVNLVVDIGGD